MQEPVLEPKNVNRFQFFIHFVTEKKKSVLAFAKALDF